MATTVNSAEVSTTGLLSGMGGKVLQTYLIDITADGQVIFTLPFTYVDGDLIFVTLYNRELTKGINILDEGTDFVVSGTTLTLNERFGGLAIAGQKIELNG